MAELLLASMESEWDPDKYHDTHRQKVEALIEAKRTGNEIVTGTEEAPASTKVVDLMEVLSASIDSVKSRRTAKPAAGPGAGGTSKATPIKKAAKAGSKASAPAPAKRTARSAKAAPKAKTPRRKAS